MRSFGSQLATFCFCLIIFNFNEAQVSASSSSHLKVGFYRHKCPSAESIVRHTVRKMVARNPGFTPGLVRMHFHDCFVRGCDASILLDSVPGSPLAEKDSPANNPSLRGFEVIAEAKYKLESLCPSTVSCADILAFAARDAARIAGGIKYAVPAGRRDGIHSFASDIPGNLPPPSSNAAQLTEIFAKKGLTVDEMVTLSGAHSLGVSHCSSFSNRLYNFSATHKQDPALDPKFAELLKAKCPLGANGNLTVSMDLSKGGKNNDRLDIGYYVNLAGRRGVLTSDQTLYDSELTVGAVKENIRMGKGQNWKKKFAEAMVRMGETEVMTGSKGEIRRQCNVVNYETPELDSN